MGLKEVTVEDVDNPNKVEDVKPEPKAQEKKEEPQYVSVEELQKIQKQLNGLSYIGRKFDDLSRKIESFQQPVTQPVVAITDQDEYDKLVEKDWKAAVRKLAQEEAARLRAEERQAEAKARMEQQQLSTLEKSKKTVLEKYPDIADSSSETSQKYAQIVAQHPEYLSNEFGPVLAMREMEDMLRTEGKLDDVSKKVVDKEVERRTRVGASSIPKSLPNSKSKATLSKEDKDFCDFNGIKYDVYLRNKERMSSDKQVEE